MLQALSNHVEDQDAEAFTEEVKSYDTISRLESWYTGMLLKIKKQIPNEDELR